jgi:hypothetical protein
MSEELKRFLKKKKLSFFSNIYTVLDALEDAGEDDLLHDVEVAMDDYSLDGRNRVSTLIAMVEENGTDEEESDEA